MDQNQFKAKEITELKKDLEDQNRTNKLQLALIEKMRIEVED